MSKSCHCKKPAECEECPEWIFTFADLVMLMMGFFVILWVLKPPAGNPGASPAQAKAQDDWLNTVGKIRGEFGYQPNPRSADPVDRAMLRHQKGRKEGAETDVRRESAAGTDHEVQTIRQGNESIVGSRLLFDAGSARLTPEASHVLDDLAEKIKGHTVIVVVKGHTSADDLGDDATAAQKMELSLRRAQSAADYLVGQGVGPEMLRVEGCSTFEPVKSGDYAVGGQAANRRVEVEETSQLIDERRGGATAAVAPLAPLTQPAN